MKKFNDNLKQKLYIGFFIIIYLIIFTCFIIKPKVNKLRTKENLKLDLEDKQVIISNFSKIILEKEKENNKLINNISSIEAMTINDENYDLFLYRLNAASREGFSVLNIEIIDRIDEYKENTDYILLKIKTKGSMKDSLDFFDDLYDDYKNIVFEEIEILDDDHIYIVDCNIGIYL